MNMGRVDLHTPRGLALVAGVVLALVAIYFHFSGFGAYTSYGFWLMALAYVVTALFGAGMVELNPQPLPPKEH
jgi:heme A synthase